MVEYLGNRRDHEPSNDRAREAANTANHEHCDRQKGEAEVERLGLKEPTNCAYRAPPTPAKNALTINAALRSLRTPMPRGG